MIINGENKQKTCLESYCFLFWKCLKTLLTLSSEQGIDIPWERILSAGSDIQYASHKSCDYIIDIENVRSAFCTLYIGIDFRKKIHFSIFLLKKCWKYSV